MSTTIIRLVTRMIESSSVTCSVQSFSWAVVLAEWVSPCGPPATRGAVQLVVGVATLRRFLTEACHAGVACVMAALVGMMVLGPFPVTMLVSE